MNEPAEPSQASTSPGDESSRGRRRTSPAGRVWAWTSRSIVSAIILVAGIGFGRQVLRWWAEDAPPVAAARHADDGDDPAATHQIQFGDQPWSLVRQSLRGSRDEAIAALRRAVREFGHDSPMPGGDMPPGEAALLESLRDEEPTDREGNQWRVFVETSAVPLVVAVRRNQPNGSADADRAPHDRVVCWGTMIPFSEIDWTLYIFVSGGSTVGGGENIPIPPGGRVILALRSAGGAGMVAFRGEAKPPVWQAFYDAWAAGQGYENVGGWRDAPGGLAARFGPAAGTPGLRWDVQLLGDDSGRMRGLVVLTPAANETGQSPRNE